MRLFSFIKNFFIDKKKNFQSAKVNEIEIRKTQQESLDRLNGAFNHLIVKLENINDSLTKHISQQDELLRRFEIIPQITQRQTELIEQTLEQINDQSRSTKKFIEVVARIPDEAIRQTRELEKIKAEVADGTGFEKALCQEFIKMNTRFKYLTIVMYCLSGIITVIAVIALIAYTSTH